MTSYQARRRDRKFEKQRISRPRKKKSAWESKGQVLSQWSITVDAPADEGDVDTGAQEAEAGAGTGESEREEATKAAVEAATGMLDAAVFVHVWCEAVNGR